MMIYIDYFASVFMADAYYIYICMILCRLFIILVRIPFCFVREEDMAFILMMVEYTCIRPFFFCEGGSKCIIYFDYCFLCCSWAFRRLLPKG